MTALPPRDPVRFYCLLRRLSLNGLGPFPFTVSLTLLSPPSGPSPKSGVNTMPPQSLSSPNACFLFLAVVALRVLSLSDGSACVVFDEIPACVLWKSLFYFFDPGVS